YLRRQVAAIGLLRSRKARGEEVGFDVADVPGYAEAVKYLDKVKELKKAGREEEAEKLELPDNLPALSLSDAQIRMYAAHPRLDLFVDGNSPHSAEKFGCTICHAGQGSATDFTLAAHTPDNVHQRAEWEKEHSWEPFHDWEFPMLPARFVESGC